MANEEIRVGLIGAGRNTRERHIREGSSTVNLVAARDVRKIDARNA